MLSFVRMAENAERFEKEVGLAKRSGIDLIRKIKDENEALKAASLTLLSQSKAVVDKCIKEGGGKEEKTEEGDKEENKEEGNEGGKEGNVSIEKKGEIKEEESKEGQDDDGGKMVDTNEMQIADKEVGGEKREATTEETTLKENEEKREKEEGEKETTLVIPHTSVLMDKQNKADTLSGEYDYGVFSFVGKDYPWIRTVEDGSGTRLRFLKRIRFTRRVRIYY